MTGQPQACSQVIGRVESLLKIAAEFYGPDRPAPQAAWYDTHRKVADAERRFEVRWDGVRNIHVPATPGRVVRAKTGSYGRETVINGRACVAALNAEECAALGLEPGPANY